MRADLTWLTMGNLPLILPETTAYAMAARSKSPLVFNVGNWTTKSKHFTPLDFNT